MGLSDIGNQAIVGMGDLDQTDYVAGMAGSHFDQAYLSLFIEGKQGQWHSYVIVQIALSGGNPVACGKHGPYQFLCSGLAVGAGKGYDRQSAA